MHLALLAAFASGLLLWTLLEYVLHRFGGHLGWFGRAIQGEHLSHHARPATFSPAIKKLALAIPVLTVIGACIALGAGPVAGAAVASGTGVGWLGYEALHRLLHVRGPLNRYGQWARRHHLHHHFGSPKVNHGVSTPLWDWAFGTLEPVDVVVVPRRHRDAFPWVARGFPGFVIG